MPRTEQTLILASKSPVRHEILLEAGILHEIMVSEVDEDAIKTHLADRGLKPNNFAAHLAFAKADKVSRNVPDALVLGADQTLIFNDEIYSKPKTVADAKARLKDMRGRWHHLQTAACLLKDGRVLWQVTAKADLKMRSFSDDFLDSYLESTKDTVCETVGGYRIEDKGLQLFERIEGDHYTILGLPLLSLIHALQDWDYLTS